MRNLTRGEAQRRAALLEVASYDLHLDLTVGAEHFLSTTVVTFGCSEPGASTFLELDAELVSAVRGGRPLEHRDCRIPLDDLAAQERVEVVARCAYSRTGEGLHRFTDPADGRTYVSMQAFLDDAQRVFACFDQPDLKAVFRVVVDAPEGWTVVGNARVEQDGCRWTFAPTEPLSTYLVHVSAGPWHGVTQVHDGIELGLWCRQSLAEHLDADELFAVTRASLDHQQRVFGRRYPFGDTYDQLFVPDFDNDAMENAGAVTFTEDFVPRSRVTQGWRRRRAMTIAHEMAHMWFGDLVTMRWWDDLWLNESFAELMGYSTVDEATRFDGVWTDFCHGRKAWGYRADAAPTTHPISGDVPDTRRALLNFDGISYAKGAAVLRQLQAALGPETFFTGVRAYLDRHAGGSTSLGDLLAELEAAAGRDLTGWARSWLQEPGTSTLRTEESPQGLVVCQESPVLREHRIDVGRYGLEGGRLVLQDRVAVHVRGARTLTGIRPADLVLLNDRDLTFAKIRFDGRSLATVVDHLADLEDPLARALCSAALWDALRDAELPAATYLRAVTPVLRVESDPSVVETLLAQLATAAGRFTAPQRQRAARAGV
ncbi:MAG: aminopeptidase, partial [Frankiales bacterium]|nr:aminopeptidase [Frankiales bacterium]